MQTIFLRMAMLLSVLAMTACTILPERQTINIRQYSLPLVSEAVSEPANADAGVLLISRPRANKAFDTLLMAYRYDLAEVSYYSESRWVDSPAQLISDGLQTQLEKQGLFAATVPQGTPVSADWRLELELLSFVQDYSASDPVFNVELRVRLINVLERNIAATKVFSAVEPMRSSNAEAGVDAAVRANSRLIADVVQFLAKVTETHTVP